MPVTHAAAKAGYSSRSGEGSKLARNKKVLDRIRYLIAEETKVYMEKRRRLEERQWLIRDADISEFYDLVEEEVIVGGKPVLDEDSNPVMRMRQRPKLFAELPPELRACIESYTLTDSGKANLKLYSKQDAHEKLCKMLGIDRVAEKDKAPVNENSDDALKSLADSLLDLANKIESSVDNAAESA
jgi:hypothetical protein